jgi:hypothetical protein
VGRTAAAAIIVIVIAAADETLLDLNPGIAGIPTAQAQSKRGRARAVGARCEANKTAAEKAACCKATG